MDRRRSSFLSKDSLLAVVAASAPDLDGPVDELRRYVERLDAPRVEVGWPSARSLLGVWRHRYEEFGLERSFAGWGRFFDVLAAHDGVVGSVGLRDFRLLRFIVILDADAERVLAFVSRRR